MTSDSRVLGLPHSRGKGLRFMIRSLSEALNKCQIIFFAAQTLTLNLSPDGFGHNVNISV